MGRITRTARFIGILIACLGISTTVTAATHPPHAMAFASAEDALAKAITTLNHESNISNIGFAGSANNETLDLAISLKRPITRRQANALVKAYMKNARAHDPRYRQFIKPYKFEIRIYRGTLTGKLLLVGMKSPRSLKIRWARKSSPTH